MNTESFIFYAKQKIFIKILQEMFKQDFTNFELNRPLPKQKRLTSNWINER